MFPVIFVATVEEQWFDFLFFFVVGYGGGIVGRGGVAVLMKGCDVVFLWWLQ